MSELKSVETASSEPQTSGELPVVHAVGLVKEFRGGDGGVIRILNEVSITVKRGEMVAIVGASGAGKSTLLHVLGALERPSAGRIELAGHSVGGLDDDAVATLRNRAVGFVFQFHHLLREFSALENVMMPQLIAGTTRAAAADRARDLLTRMGLEPRIDHCPTELSGGEQQRVAICRALANRPLLLLADEPTGNLDPETAARVHDELLRLIEDEGLGALVATHNLDLAEGMSRIARLERGMIVS
jgi:lipoprotein-releasing system ATP-binding protein